MWKEMRWRVYIIVVLALVNIAIMKYQDSRQEKIGTLAISQDEKIMSDSLLSLPRR